MKFLLTVFYIILFFYVLSLVGRTMLTVWVRRRQRDFNRADRQYKSNARARAKKEEGRITIRDTRTQQKRVDEYVGEYVEYEELTPGDTKEENGTGTR